jgi:hypothetical protein
MDALIGEGNIIEHSDAAKMSSRQLLSEFGTAREAILSLLRNFSDDDWTSARETADGTTSIEQIVDDLIASDQKYVDQILNAAG